MDVRVRVPLHRVLQTQPESSALRLELPQIKMKKFGQELCGLERLLEEFEKCVDEQKQQLQKLKVRSVFQMLAEIP